MLDFLVWLYFKQFVQIVNFNYIVWLNVYVLGWIGVGCYVLDCFGILNCFGCGYCNIIYCVILECIDCI